MSGEVCGKRCQVASATGQVSVIHISLYTYVMNASYMFVEQYVSFSEGNFPQKTCVTYN